MASAFAQMASASNASLKNFAKAMQQAVKEKAQSIESEAILWVLKCTAFGFYYLAIQDHPDAASAFEAAGIWAAIGGASAGIGAAMGGGASGSSGGGAGGSMTRGAPGVTSGIARGIGGYAGQNQTNVQVNIQGVMSADTIGLITPTLVSAINLAVNNGSAQLISTTTTRPPNRTAGR